MPFSKEVSFSISMFTIPLKTVTIFAVDLVGNTQLVPTNFTWEVDRTPPHIWPVRLPPALNNLSAFNVSFTWSEELSGLWWSTDGSAFQAIAVSSTQRTVTLLVRETADGNHTMALKGIVINIAFAFLHPWYVPLHRRRCGGKCIFQFVLLRVDEGH